MTFVLLILLLTGVIVACTVVLVRRGSEDRAAAQSYLDAPTWSGSMAGGSATTDLTAPAAAAPAPPEGARLRGAEAAAADLTRRDDRLLAEVVEGLARIPPLPHVLVQVLGELDNAGSSARSLADIVAAEPVLTAALLRVANSAASGLSRCIISLDDAVAYLGYSTVRTIVLRMKLADLMPAARRDGADAPRGYDSEQLWLHSLVVGQVAAHLATRAGAGGDACDPSLVATIGLLHDIGKLAINSQFPDSVARLWEREHNGPPDESFLARERRLFGADHAFIGGFLAAQWKLPAELVDAIRLHHVPVGRAAEALSPELRRATCLVHVANQLAKYANVYCADMEIDIVPPSLLAELKLPPNLEDLMNDDVRVVIGRAAQLCAPAPRRAA